MRATSRSGERPDTAGPRRLSHVLVVVGLAASGLAAALATSSPAAAADVVLVPPALTYSPDLSAGPAALPCADVAVRCVGPTGEHATIQAAIDAAGTGDTVQVQAGTYTERVTVSGKTLRLLGGFAPGFAARDATANVTTIDGQSLGTSLSLSEAGDSLVDGFVITGGRAPLNEFGQASGSGMRVDISGEVTVSHNVFEGNDDVQNLELCNCYDDGGGLFADSYLDGASINVVDNIFRNNQALRGAALFISIPARIEGNLIEDNIGGSDHGGGLFLAGDQTVLRGNLIRDNEIGAQAGYGWGGGGIFVGNTMAEKPSILLEANRWVGNSAPTRGSAFFVDESASATVVGDLFHDNACASNGVFYVDGGGGFGSSATLENVTITHHSCAADAEGSGIVAEGGSRFDLTNSIVSGNGGLSELWQQVASVPNSTVTHSVTGAVSGAVTPGAGVLTDEPAFVSPSDFHLAADSVGIDAANPASTVGAEPAPNGGRRNAGAYGGTAEATTTSPDIVAPTITPTWPTPTYGKTASVQVQVTGAGSPATGQVELLLDGSVRATADLNDQGRATLNVPGPSLLPGNRLLVLRYLGSSAVSAEEAQTTVAVRKATPGRPTIKVSRTPTSRATGRATVTVATPAALSRATGKVTVQLTKGSTKRTVSGRLANGKVVLTLPKLAKGTWKVSGAYAGDARYLKASLKPSTIRVTR